MMICFPLNSIIAGMPVPLPYKTETYQQLSGSFTGRLEAISFFLIGLLICAFLVKILWNTVRKDFPKLPSISFVKALAATILWGLLFVIVLTMISGARELMTPGAWEKNGATYRLASQTKNDNRNSNMQARKDNLEKLRTNLWHYAATHQGKFPSQNNSAAVADIMWSVPQSGNTRYLYVAKQSANTYRKILVFEPELSQPPRLVLLTNGEIVELTSNEIKKLLEKQNAQ